jgi:hypothetical protein
MFTRYKQKINSAAIAQSSSKIALLLLAVTLVFVSFSLFAPVLTWILLLIACGVVIRTAIYCYIYKHYRLFAP